MIFSRSLAPIIKNINDTFPVLLITGPRQVGKTTLLKLCADQKRNYVTLDDHHERKLAQTDPTLFLQTHKTPLIIDEVQYAPELFSSIKMAVDTSKQMGQFWLTGSQKFHLMKGVTESLAGRVAILDMLGLSQAEIDSRANSTLPFLPTQEWISNAKTHTKTTTDLMAIFEKIWRGSFPRLSENTDISWDVFYNSYVQTYVQRDVRDILNITNELSFMSFLKAAAARTGQILNLSNIARDVEIDHKTAKAWLSVLEASGLIYLLYPYRNNVTKRLIKAPKLYFLDTGLCSFLTQWNSPASLEAGAMSGAILETYVLSEIIKSYWNQGKREQLYYYRDTDQKEIDLVIEDGGQFYPVEIKKTASPSLSATKSFSELDKLNIKVGQGAVICFRPTDIPLSREVTAIPIGYL